MISILIKKDSEVAALAVCAGVAGISTSRQGDQRLVINVVSDSSGAPVSSAASAVATLYSDSYVDTSQGGSSGSGLLGTPILSNESPDGARTIFSWTSVVNAVFVNGQLMLPTTDYTTPDSFSVVLNVAPDTGHWVAKL